ncbi:hypothetical protein SDC9_147948 [bioreactor metagenome]|uniref:Uncharacterized protein n=1 Tax=bioreactor metagenome TaxID=1076179 RepID=A0A645EHL1_9ZZZZ
MAAIIAAALVDGVINQLGFCRVMLADSGQTTVGFNPAKYPANHIDAEGWRGVIQGIIFGVGFIAEHGWNGLRIVFKQVFADNDHRYSGRSQIFLSAGVN